MTTFNSAFAAARRAGKKTFSWNGKSYNTQTRSGSAPSSSQRPAARPAAARSAPATSSRPTTRESAAGPSTRPKARPARVSTPGADQAREHNRRNTRRSDASRVRTSR